jgi:hypothetical protein
MALQSWHILVASCNIQFFLLKSKSKIKSQLLKSLDQSSNNDNKRFLAPALLKIFSKIFNEIKPMIKKIEYNANEAKLTKKL